MANIKLAFGGDIAPVTLRKYIYGDLANYLKVCDVRIANLEIALTNESTPLKNKIYPHKGPPEAIDMITNDGFGIFNIANNHILDYGENALLESMTLLSKKGIPFVGSGLNIKEASKPLIINKNDVRIGFIGFTTTIPIGFSATEEKMGVYPIRVITSYEQFRNPEEYPGTAQLIKTYPVEEDLKKLSDSVRKLKQEVDIILIYAHWGTSMTSDVHDFQRIIAHEVIDSGANAIFGGHQHVISGVEFYKECPIIYGLGNLIFDFSPPFFDERTRECLVYFADISKDSIQNSKILICKTAVNDQVNLKDALGKDSHSFNHFKKLCSDLGTECTIGDHGFIALSKA